MTPDSELSRGPGPAATPPAIAVDQGGRVRLRERETYKTLFVNPWTYTTGAVVLALLNVVLLLATGKAWGVTTSLTYWGAWVWRWLGGQPQHWRYFAEIKPAFNRPGFDFLADAGSLTNVGIVLGALLAALLANQFRVKKLKAKRQIVAAVAGGLLMGFGARLAFGCNIGAMFTAIPALSLHGWVFLVSIFAGAAVGSRLLLRYFV